MERRRSDWDKVRERLSDRQVCLSLLERVSGDRSLFAKGNPAFWRLVADVSGLSVDTLLAHRDRAWRLLVRLLGAKCRSAGRAAAGEGGSAGGGASTFYYTPAQVLYWALYEVYGVSAVEEMYRILEPLVSGALTGGGGDAWLLFVPVSPEHLDAQLQLLARLLPRSLCRGEGRRVLGLLCAPSSTLPRQEAQRCERLLSRLLSGVCES